MTWKPHLTVAAVIEKNNQFLLVEEISNDKVVINQPAGHVEFGETIVQAVIRETLEETAYDFLPEALIGVYYWYAKSINITYLRFAFKGRITGHHPERPLDSGILDVKWYSREQLVEKTELHRSPIVLRCVDDYLSNKQYPLELITNIFPDLNIGL